jgi:hypothetical protein
MNFPLISNFKALNFALLKVKPGRFQDHTLARVDHCIQGALLMVISSSFPAIYGRTIAAFVPGSFCCVPSAPLMDWSKQALSITQEKN